MPDFIALKFRQLYNPAPLYQRSHLETSINVTATALQIHYKLTGGVTGDLFPLFVIICCNLHATIFFFFFFLPHHLNLTHKNSCPDRNLSSARLIEFHLEFGRGKNTKQTPNHLKDYQTRRNTIFFDGTKIGLFGSTLSSTPLSSLHSVWSEPGHSSPAQWGIHGEARGWQPHQRLNGEYKCAHTHTCTTERQKSSIK